MASLIKVRRRRPIRESNLPTRITPRRLFEEVCRVMGTDEQAAKSRSRKARLVKTRAIYAYLGREFKFTFDEIGGSGPNSKKRYRPSSTD